MDLWKRLLPMTKSAPGAARIVRLDDLPLWLFALLTVVAFNAIALGGLVCMRRFIQSLGLYTFIDNDTVSAIFSAILVMYAISLGLIAVASWGNASAAAAAAPEEVSHIATVYRTLGGYPQSLQDDLKNSLVRYTQSIIEKAWPAQRRGEVTEAGIDIILHLWKQITHFEPTTDGQHVVHGQVLNGFNMLVEFRRRRIEATAYAVPGACRTTTSAPRARAQLSSTEERHALISNAPAPSPTVPRLLSCAITLLA
jgi:hypothetical protein